MFIKWKIESLQYRTQLMSLPLEIEKAGKDIFTMGSRTSINKPREIDEKIFTLL